jgi:hypothetical protein
VRRNPDAEAEDHMIWLVNDDKILRVSKRVGEEAHLHAREVHVRNVIRAQYLQLGLSPDIIPLPIAFGSVGNHVDGIRSVTLDALVTGVDLENTDLTSKTTDDLVQFLRVLRTISPTEMKSKGLPFRELPDLANTHASAVNSRKILLENNQFMKDHAGTTTFHKPDPFLYESTISICASVRATPEIVLLHADMKGEHIFADPVDGSILGILDWTDTAVGNPAIDICGLAISVGSNLAIQIALRAGYSVNTAILGIFIARCETTIRLDNRLNGDDLDSPEHLLRRQLQRAFEIIDS